jgi:putative ABC transport system ATP-binding protein
MVTHDPVAAAYADRVIFLADGRIVDEMYGPTAESVLDTMRHLSGGNPQTPEFDAKGRTS